VETRNPVFEREQMEAERRQEREDIRTAADQWESDVRWLVSGPAGRRVVWRLFHDAQLDSSPYNPNASLSAFQMGQQKFAAELRTTIERLSPDEYLLIRQENER
jgi:hypothetical protein